MIGLRPEIARYLASAFPEAEAKQIAGDASTRRFFRITTANGTTRVLMDYGLPFEDETDDVRLARVFREAGLRIAEILDVSGPAGCLLLEDLGDTSLEAATTGSDGQPRPDARAIIERAVILAAQVANRGTPVLARSERRQGPALDSERFRFEMDFFLEHFVAGLRGHDPPPDGLREALHALADRAADTPRRVMCHRDFHGRNLMLPPDGSLAMVDIQDARWGPDSYDLASLLRDAYLPIPDDWVGPLTDLYLSALDEPASEGFHSRLDRVSVQRMIKALGTFGYQATVREAPRYLGAIPRTLHRLRQLMPQMSELRPLREYLDEARLLDD